MKLLVQEYLENHTFEQLEQEHGVYASFSQSGHKWSLNYDQLESKETDVLAQQCRGLILSAVDGKSFLPEAKEVDGRLKYTHICPGPTMVLAYPMDRFFNYGQACAALIDWNDPSLCVQEKLDGTLTILYYDKFAAQWCVATRSVPEANLPIDFGFYTFRTLFEKALGETAYKTGYAADSSFSFNEFTSKLCKDNTYCFELTSPYNRIVVDYKTAGLTLLCIRNNSSFKELKIYSEITSDQFIDEQYKAASYCMAVVPLVKSFKLNNINDIIDWVSSQNPTEYEGVVVRDSKGRNKIKNAAYVAYNRARDVLGASDRNCLELILAEKDDDVLSILPEEIVKNIQDIKTRLLCFITKHDTLYWHVKHIPSVMQDKKSFALYLSDIAKDRKLWTAPLFQMYDKKVVDMKDFILKNKKEGTWSNSFLDRILEGMKNYKT